MPKFRMPRFVVVIVCALPAVLTGLFYALAPLTGVMDWAAACISKPVRGFFGLLSSVYPLSLMEVVCTAAVIWLIYYLVKTVAVTLHRRNKWKILGKRMLLVAVVALYIWSSFCWLWNSGYHARGFAQRSGFSGGGVAVEDLTFVAGYFAEMANELAPVVKRDEDGNYIEERDDIFDAATSVYVNALNTFPELDGSLYRPKSMLFSWLMSRTGYTGIYFALTGEANINTRMPMSQMPATVAHELAHQLGVFAEDEANFVGITACVISGNPVYEYSGYLSGLSYLLNALASVDSLAWSVVYESLSELVLRDRQESYDYWRSQETVDTGVQLLDNILTVVTETVSDTVDVVYDGYLKSQKQELGLRSYGACVDLLVEYFRH